MTLTIRIYLSKATDEQLENIIRFDQDCPAPLLRGVVEEALNRGLFDDLFADCVHRITGNITKFEQTYKIGLEDLAQVGRLAVIDAVKRFKTGKGASFFTFAYIRVKSMIIREIEPLQTQKRDARKVVSLQKENENGNTFAEILADRVINVEKYVTDKLMVEHLLSRVNEHQRQVLLYRMQGYEFKEISQLLGRGTGPSMSQAYNLAIKKMRGITA